MPDKKPGQGPEAGKVECIQLPRNLQVRCEGEMRQNDNELWLFDSFAQEHTNIGGTDVDIYIPNLKKSRRDPLYNEPTVPVFDGPFRVRVYATDIEYTPEASERGFRQIFTASLWLPRKTVEDAKIMPPPREGSVVLIWKTPYFDRFSEPEPFIPGLGFYFDVLKADVDGHPFDNSGFVGFKMDVKRRTSFNPERRLEQP